MTSTDKASPRSTEPPFDEPGARSGLSFGDLIPDTRTPMQKRADGIAKAINRLLDDAEARQDARVWTDLLERRHGLPETEQRGFDTRLRRELIAFVNEHAAERDREQRRNYKSFVVDLPLRKTVSAHIFTEMGWWKPGSDDVERYAQIQWLEDKLQHGGLRPQRSRPSPFASRPGSDPGRQVQHADSKMTNNQLAVIVLIAVVLLMVLVG